MKKIFPALLLTLLLSLSGCQSPPRALPLPLAFWDWQTEVPLSETDQYLLKQAPVSFVIVKAGALNLEGASPALEHKMTPEALASYGPIPLVFCYRPSPEFTSAFEAMDPAATGKWLGSRILEDIREGEAMGAAILGAQIDFDCPTRLLSRYALMLHETRAVLRASGNYELSVTAMETWLHHLSFRAIVKETDYFVPILYGYDIPMKEQDLPPLSSPSRLKWALRLASLFGKPYWIGLPSYTGITVYDEKGLLAAVEGDLSLAELASSPNLQYEGNQSEPGSRELRHRFKALRDFFWKDRLFKKGWEVVAEETTAAQWGKLMEEVREHPGANLEGVVCYRLDKRGKNNSLRTEAILRLDQEPFPAHSLQTSAKIRSWDGKTMLLSANLANTDPYAGLFGYSPGLLEIRIKDAVFESAGSGDFPGLDYAVGFEDKAFRATPARANLLRLETPRLEPLASLATGIVRIRKTGPDFSVFLYGGMDSSLLFKRLVCGDYEVYPNPAEPGYKIQEGTIHLAHLEK
jgi:hypothetical protein